MRTQKPRKSVTTKKLAQANAAGYRAGFAAGIKKESEVRELEMVGLYEQIDEQHALTTGAQALVVERDAKIATLSQRIDELAREKSELERQNAHFVSEVSTLHYENSQVETLLTDICRFVGRFEH